MRRESTGVKLAPAGFRGREPAPLSRFRDAWSRLSKSRQVDIYSLGKAETKGRDGGSGNSGACQGNNWGERKTFGLHSRRRGVVKDVFLYFFFFSVPVPLLTVRYQSFEKKQLRTGNLRAFSWGGWPNFSGV